MSTSKTLGKGVDIEYDDKTLTITIDITKNFGDSGSGKSTVIASTKGNKDLDNGMTLGLNLYRKK